MSHTKNIRDNGNANVSDGSQEDSPDRSTSHSTDNIPEYAFPNKGKKAGLRKQPEEECTYSPVSYNHPNKDKQPVMQGANGNQEEGWMENNIYDTRDEDKGSYGKEGWKANSIYDTREEYEGANETEGWKANTIYDTKEEYAGSHETEGWEDNSIYATSN